MAIWKEFDFAESLDVKESKEMVGLVDLMINLKDYGIEDEEPDLLNVLLKQAKKYKLFKMPDEYKII